MKKFFLLFILNIIFVNSLFTQSPYTTKLKFPWIYDSYSVVNGDTLMEVFLSSNPQTLNNFKQNLGLTKNINNNIATGTIPLSKFRTLNTNDYQWITTTKKAQPMLDQSQLVVNAKIGRDISGMTGEGTIIGIVEVNGIDSQNDDFFLYVTDRSVTGPHYLSY